MLAPRALTRNYHTLHSEGDYSHPPHKKSVHPTRHARVPGSPELEHPLLVEAPMFRPHTWTWSMARAVHAKRRPLSPTVTAHTRLQVQLVGLIVQQAFHTEQARRSPV